MSRRNAFPRTIALIVLTVASIPGTLLAQPKAADVLKYEPSQKDIVVDIPTAQEVAQCKLESQGNAWILLGPNGQLLRRFMDTNNDRVVDEFRYYQHGIEVFRDLDSNADNKPDQFRWLNTAGSRWGVDRDGDSKVDLWRVISAEEASREAVMALVTRDIQRLNAVLITAEEINQLGITGDAAKTLQERLQQTVQTFRTVVESAKSITPKTQWTRFDCSMLMPNLIPAEAGKTKNDLLVYENVMAIIDNSGQSAFMHVGEMILVGQTWKVTQVPKLLDNGTMVADGGTLLQPVVAAMGSSEGVSEKMRDLIDKLKVLDNAAPAANAPIPSFVTYNVSRANLLAELARESTTEEEKMMWLRQRVEGIATATGMEAFPNGMEELRKDELALRQPGASQDLLAFTTLQRMGVEHNLALQKAAQEDRPKLQEAWQTSLQNYIKEFSRSPDAGAAVFELARLHEFNGNPAQALNWYQQLTKNYPQSPSAERGKGAVMRLNLKGQPLKLTGAVYGANGRTLDTSALRGKVLAVIFWATWCQPCTEDLPQIQELHRTLQRDGFEVIGVNLDSPGAPIDAYIKNQKVTWPHIHEEGGLESRPAIEFGIVSLPTMILVNRKGDVVNPGATVQDLKTEVPLLLKQ